MAFGIEIQSWVLGRKVEKERERERERMLMWVSGLWVSGLLFMILEKYFGLLIVIFYNLINVFFKFN